MAEDFKRTPWRKFVLRSRSWFHSIIMAVSLTAAPTFAFASAGEGDEATSSDRQPASYRPPSIQQTIQGKPPAPEGAQPPLHPVNPTDVQPSNAEPERSETLTGDWGGARQRLSERGFDFAAIYKVEGGRLLGGGLEDHSWVMHNLDLRLSVDAAKLAGWTGTSFFFYGLGDWGADDGHTPSRYIGDAQGTSNIETRTDSFKLYEAWAQHLFAEDRVSILFGLHDLNSEFYVTDTSSLFFNASFGVGRELSQTGVNGPAIFPTTSTALRLRVEPSKSWAVQLAVFDAQAGDPSEPKGTSLRYSPHDGTLLIAEVDYFVGRDSEKPSETPGKYGVGAWGYSRTFNHLSETVTTADGTEGAAQAASSGAYVFADQNLSKNVSLFVRHGVASTATNPAGTNTSAGIVARGLIPFRENDKWGLALTQSTPGLEYRSSLGAQGTSLAGDEVTYESTYRAEISPGFAVIPDFQYVVHPGYSATTTAAQVGSVRVELSF